MYISCGYPALQSDLAKLLGVRQQTQRGLSSQHSHWSLLDGKTLESARAKHVRASQGERETELELEQGQGRGHQGGEIAEGPQWKLSSAKGFLLFPFTNHIENVVVLDRVGGRRD